jgi:hypothetical protein
MDMNVYLSAVGKYQQELEDEFGIDPRDGLLATPANIMNLEYTVMIHDGTIELGDFAEVWMNLWQSLCAYPAVGAGLIWLEYLSIIARMLGAKNMNDFVARGGALKIQTMQDH